MSLFSEVHIKDSSNWLILLSSLRRTCTFIHIYIHKILKYYVPIQKLATKSFRKTLDFVRQKICYFIADRHIIREKGSEIKRNQLQCNGFKLLSEYVALAGDVVVVVSFVSAKPTRRREAWHFLRHY